MVFLGKANLFLVGAAALFLLLVAVFFFNAPEQRQVPLSLNLADAQPMAEAVISNGGVFQLEAGEVRKELGGRNYSLYAYNGQLPGPVITVEQGWQISVNFTNNLRQATTVHWHGLRLKNEFDGVPEVTQKEVKPGESFLYQLVFPDEGIYWYHPHVREEEQQEKGLYGVIIVKPRNASYYGKVNREEIIVLDDLLLDENGEPYEFPQEYTNFAAMGRYGNLPLLNWQRSYSLTVEKGEIVRFLLLNTANARPFRVQFEGAQMRVVGSDNGKYEKEFAAEAVTLAPSERYVVEVLFDSPGKHAIVNSNPEAKRKLGEVRVIEKEVAQKLEFALEKTNSEVTASISEFEKYFAAPVDFDFELGIDIEGATMMDGLMEHGEDGIEWEDTMFAMNKISTSEQVSWKITDRRTGRQNEQIEASVPVGKPFKMRLFNKEKHSLHPMQHAIHLHGARFLVLSADGERNQNFAWKDAVLVPMGATVEILAEFPNPGEWMLHCHIAEHLSSGMMASIKAA